MIENVPFSNSRKSKIWCTQNATFCCETFLHASWSQLTNFVSYKAEEVGRRVELVDPKNTSQECSNCGRIVKKPLSQRTHKCPFCGLVMDRDQNAAINILKKGLQKSSIFEQLKKLNLSVGQELSEFKPEDLPKAGMIQEALPFRAG